MTKELETGFPHPILKKNNDTKPIKDTCLTGFKDILPCFLGVGSPNNSAVLACENSWKVIAKISAGKDNNITKISSDGIVIKNNAPKAAIITVIVLLFI